MKKLSGPIKPNEAYISSSELARMVGATKNQILHWARSGHIEHRESTYRMFPVSASNKASVMAALVNGIGQEPNKATKLADKLLQRFDDRPCVVRAILAFLEALDSQFDSLFEVISNQSLYGPLLELAKKKHLLEHK